MIDDITQPEGFSGAESGDAVFREAYNLPRHRGWKLAAAFGVAVAVIAAGVAFGGEWGHVAFSAWEVIPFTVLALLAYVGTQKRWAKALTLVVLAVIVLGVGLTIAFLTVVVVFESESIARPDADADQLLAIAGIDAVLICGGIGGAILIAFTGFLPGVRRSLARVVPLDAQSFVHTVALVVVVGLTLVSFVPLLVLSAPPILSLLVILLAEGVDLTDGRGPAGMLLDELYALVWLVPATIFAVGYGVRRNLRQALERLGLARSTWRQVAMAVGLAIVLVMAVAALSPAVDWAWDWMAWPKTDIETFEHLLAHFFSPVGAVVLGVVAGLGEELAVRGVLQPRLGIWLSNLFFTGLHALQYNWDALLMVFLLGLVFGLIRKKTSTTTSAIVHGTYDFLLIMAVVVGIPLFPE